VLAARLVVRDPSVLGVTFLHYRPAPIHCQERFLFAPARDGTPRHVPQRQSKSAVADFDITDRNRLFADFDINHTHRVSQRDVPWLEIGFFLHWCYAASGRTMDSGLSTLGLRATVSPRNDNIYD
jgi:hypothetical protein